ncbi:alkaline phosphatase D family protein [Flagellimonas myxillae]|uniref:alkaline phosphatase D family protein n=1 Tax=Flagellimonas myxillae TaxID=2942214 RepID=UPI00201E81FE|nr:alkaline phosphatase D family protein [Muricauda myxillae]MCL6265349.1 alkaline phosphatase D family protein [Muricauda myxillae]
MKNLSFFLCATALLVINFACQNKPTAKTELVPPVTAPFTNIDTIATNDWWNRKPNEIIDVKVERENVVAFALYTVQNQTLKLTAQLFPLYPDETREVRLEIKSNDTWEELQTKDVNDLGWSALFRVDDWDSTKDTPYRVLHGEKAAFEGLIRKNPKDKEEIVLAALSCNSNQDRGDRDKYVKNINHQDPDLVFFAGDQSYDHSEHTAAWLKFGMQFREVFRNRPCITIPDDHDIGQGNLWGEYGKKASTMAGNDGGYFFHPEYVKMVERCQTAHLPDPYDPTPIEQGIGVYYTNLVVGDIDFAIIEDRKFKSGPKGKIPQIGPRPDHIRDPNYDPASVDVEGLELLGDRQLNFLNEWGQQNEGNIKVVLSQTGFCGGAHIHGNKDNRLHADMDSNGWPQTGRNKALKAIKNANAVHIAGDQHLATVIHHGIDEYEDGPWAFVVPAIVNNYYSRWWWPENEKAGANSNGKLPWNGRFLDGFNNKITMHAYVNPDNPSNGSGYGLIRFNKKEKEATFECWSRDSDVSNADAKQFNGFPITVKLD